MTPRQLIRAIDSHVGRRIRARRRLMGLSQTQLAQRLGLSFQQIQKYENGANRVSSGTLCRIAEALDAPVAFFFDGREGGYRRKPVGDGRADRLQIEVARNFAEIRGRSARRAVADLVRALVVGESTPPAAIVRTIADGTAHDAS
ncbi:MAG: helix-turn-helix domain-containing protein [Minwuiales bacterium]|nr:helix-turn-helix domain-containing protein [Minwuiales bacterium]